MTLSRKGIIGHHLLHRYSAEPLAMRTVFTKLALFGSRGWRFLGSKHLADAPQRAKKSASLERKEDLGRLSIGNLLERLKVFQGNEVVRGAASWQCLPNTIDRLRFRLRDPNPMLGTVSRGRSGAGQR